MIFEEKNGFLKKGSKQMLLLCGFGYWVNGFRLFWLVPKNCGNLPLVAKPLFGVLSDAFYIGGAHRLPYISIGVSTVMASAAGGILGNLIGGFFLLRTRQTRSMFLTFASILAFQFVLTTSMREESLGLPQLQDQTSMRRSVFQSIKKQYDDLIETVTEENICRPIMFIVGSILAVPLLSGSIFCYQTQYLNLDPSVIGMSKVTGQLMIFSMIALYNRLGKNISIKQLVSSVQVVYAFSLLLDLILVLQLNQKVGISNEFFALCFSGITETIAQFKILPFQVLLASLAPSGCEGSLMSCLASALCLSSIISGFLGVGLSSFLGITSGNYSSLPLGILIQFIAALLPLQWIDNVPVSQPLSEKHTKRGLSKRSRRNRRVGRLALSSMYSYRRERELDLNG
ncbi:hypothetical protein Leryth_016793 [Lithospermum erythrorhizon]|nr:hypothetical protein Leryth_016793 [Lithospermum erythrorhizon]